jgi:transcriptional regulator with XRE-family HTH domain
MVGMESSADAAGVGRRLRDLREARGITLSALARQAGVGKATLSGLETGTRNPTLETLFAVTAALQLPLTSILVPGGADQRGAAPTVSGSAVEATLLQVFDEDAVTYELYRIRIPPGPAQASPAHHAGVSEHVTVFSGVLRAGPADAPMVAKAGEFLSWRSDVPHAYVAVGEEEVHASLLMRYPKADATRQPARSP